jgi:hypothetical protein
MGFQPGQKKNHGPRGPKNKIRQSALSALSAREKKTYVGERLISRRSYYFSQIARISQIGAAGFYGFGFNDVRTK